MRKLHYAHTLTPLLAWLGCMGCSFMLDFDELRSDSANTGDAGAPSSDDDETDDDDEISRDDNDDDPDDDTSDDDDDEDTDDSSVGDDDDSPPDGGAGTGDADSGLVAADGGSCSEDCDDGNPCTIDSCIDEQCQNEPLNCQTDDSCTESTCVDGQCVETRLLGVVEDGFEERVEASSAFRSSLVGAGDRFYRATYGVWDGRPDILFSVFGRDGDSPLAEARASDVLPDGIVPMSPAALAPDTRLGLSLYVYAAVKADDQGDAAAGSVARMRFNRDLDLLGDVELISSLPNYRYQSDRLGPAAGTTAAGEPYVVWNGCTTTGTPEGPDCVTTEPSSGNGGLYLQFGEEQLDVSDPGGAFIADARPISGLAALDSGDAPGALWMANESPGGVDLLSGTILGDNPQQLIQCNDSDGFTGHTLDAWRSLGNLWTTSWSTRMGTSFSTELTVLRCSDGACLDLGLPADADSCTEEQSESRVLDDARSVITRTLARPGDPAERIYQSAMAVTSDDDGTSIELIVNQLDFDLSDGASINSSTPVGRVQLASGGDETTGWPALATVAPDRIAVSWLEAGDSSGSAAVRVQRYRICFAD